MPFTGLAAMKTHTEGLPHTCMLGQVSWGRRRSIAPFPDECWLQSSYADILAQVRGLESTWRPSGAITL